MPTRIWGSCAGALVFFAQKARPGARRADELLYPLGLALVARIDHRLRPADGLSGRRSHSSGTWCRVDDLERRILHAWRHFLNRQPTRFGGQISYSLYLVHWPVLVLALYGRGSALPPIQVAGLLSLTALLAVLLFYTVEHQFRSSGSTSGGRVLLNLGCVAATAVAVVPAIYVWQTNGRDAWQLPNSGNRPAAKQLRPAGCEGLRLGEPTIGLSEQKISAPADAASSSLGTPNRQTSLTCWLRAGTTRKPS